MTLAVMLSTDKDALICDFAETYHIYNIDELPVEMRAVLASGLRDDSRIKMKLAGAEYIPLSIMLPQIADNVALLRYAWTASKGDPLPALMTDYVFGTRTDKETTGFSTAAEFEAARENILKGNN